MSIVKNKLRSEGNKKAWARLKKNNWISPRKGISPSNLSLVNANKKGSGNPMWGKTTSQKQKDAVRKFSIGRIKSVEERKKISKSNSGKNGSNWKGGISPENKRIRHGIEFRLWRESVFARDNWTCQKCKERGSKLHPHHILNFSTHLELRFAIDNGITLCEICHKEFHSKNGKIFNTLEQLNKYLYER